MDQTETQKMGYGLIAPLDGPAFAAELERMHNQLYDPAIVFAQLNMLGSHDTPRLMTLANGDPAIVSLMFLCQMTIAGAPNIYYGDEIGMRGGADPDCRRAFPWHDHSLWDTTLLETVRDAIRLRHASPALRRGDFEVLVAEEQVVMYQRRCAEQTAVIALNAGPQAHTLHCPANCAATLPEVNGTPGETLRADAPYTLPARSCRIWMN